jgi:hypothetical protein
MANSDNTSKGLAFESAVGRFLSESGFAVTKAFPVAIGVDEIKRPHKFDLGGDNPKVVVECKCHSWTEGGNAPSAKMSVWNEAMYYFSLVPDNYRKMLFVLLSRFDTEGETLLAYYIRRFGHLIPFGVEIWEYDPAAKVAKCMHTPLLKRVGAESNPVADKGVA